MPKPNPLSIIGMYGNKEVFQRRVTEGYTEVAFGSGEWVGEHRIVRFFAFYHPSRKIATYEHPKAYTPTGSTIHGNPFEAEYTKTEFQSHVKEFKLSLGKRTGLAEIVMIWD